MNQIDTGTINYRDELLRKLIHLCSLSIPVIYYYTSTPTAILILSILTFFAVVLDVFRYLHPSLGKIFYMFFGFLLRKHEMDNKKKNLNGATYVFISALICVIIFPKMLVITAFTILIVSDSIAALIGRKFGKTPFLYKSLEGTLAFFLSASIVIFLTPKIEHSIMEYGIGILAAAVGAITENISYGIADDNLSIPISIGFTMWCMYLLYLPETELILLNVPR